MLHKIMTAIVTFFQEGLLNFTLVMNLDQLLDVEGNISNQFREM